MLSCQRRLASQPSRASLVAARAGRYISVMGNTLFFILILAAMVATVVALVRGIVAFLRTTEADLKGGGISQSGLKQNRMMRMRIAFQAIAVILVILLLIMSRQ